MEYLVVGLFLALFVAFIVSRVKKSKDNRGSGDSRGGAGTGRDTHEN